jgi:hypothetical protein
VPAEPGAGGAESGVAVLSCGEPRPDTQGHHEKSGEAAAEDERSRGRGEEVAQARLAALCTWPSWWGWRTVPWQYS